MLLKISEYTIDTERDPEIKYDRQITYYDDLDKLQAYILDKLQGKNWIAQHPGMIIDTYIVNPVYYPKTMNLKRFGVIKVERL